MPSQWKATLHCTIISHWLGAYTKWSLNYERAFLSKQSTMQEVNCACYIHNLQLFLRNCRTCPSVVAWIHLLANFPQIVIVSPSDETHRVLCLPNHHLDLWQFLEIQKIYQWVLRKIHMWLSIFQCLSILCQHDNSWTNTCMAKNTQRREHIYMLYLLHLTMPTYSLERHDLDLYFISRSFALVPSKWSISVLFY